MLFWIYVFYNVWFFEYVSYAGICGNKIRSFGITRKHYMGAWKIISAHLPCGVYTFEKGCPTCSAMRNLFHSRGVSCSKYAEYGDSWHCIFHNVAFPSLFVLFDGVASYFRSGYTQFLQSDGSVVKRVIYYGVVGIVFLLGCISEVMISVPLLQKVIRLICT